MKSLICGLLGSFLLFLSPPSQAELTHTDPADWVKSRAPHSKSNESQEYSASFLLFDQQIQINENDQAAYTRVVAQVNNSSGLSDLGELSISFDPIYQQLQVHHVSIIRNGQTINVLDQVEFELIRQESELSQGIYNGKETALLLISDLQVNDLLDYAYTIVGKNPIFENRVFEVFGLEWNIPVQDLYINVTIPKNKKIKYRTLKYRGKPKKRNNKNHTVYAWHLSAIPPHDHQGSYPKWYASRDYLELTEFDNWQSVAQWASAVFDINTDLNQEIHGIINQWNRSMPTDSDKATAALNYVQNEIRYLGIEIGINSHKPRIPTATFASKYGDCKDKTMLLHAMLLALGIDSQPMLVSTELNREITTRLPSPGLFNHVILQVEVDGATFWVDPTSTHQGTNLYSRALPDFAYGLVVNNQTKALSPITRHQQQVVKKYITETLDINTKQEPLQLAISTVHSGDFAEGWRATVSANPIHQIQKNFESFTHKMYGNASSTETLKVIDQPATNQLTFLEHYQLHNAWEESNRYEYIELMAYSLLSYVEMPSRLNRDSPLGLPYPLELTHQFIVNDPKKVLEHDESAANIKTDHLSYRKEIDKQDKQLIITHTFKTNQDHVNTEALSDHFNTIKEIRKNLSVVIGVPIEQKERLKESDDRLKSALQQMLKEKQ